MSQPVIIVGGGIGGLAAAIALERKGIASVVLERATQFSEIGAGIQLGPNVWKIFERLGLTEKVRALAIFPNRLVMRDGITAEEVTSVPCKEPMVNVFGYEYALIHRADMHEVLLRECQASSAVTLVSGASVCGFEESEDQVIVRTDDDRRWTGCALVGADGLWSKIRESLIGDGGPRVSGHVAYRAVLPYEQAPEYATEHAMTIYCGPGFHLVHYPLRGGKLLNLVAVFHSKRFDEGWDAYGDPAELAQKFATAHPNVRNLLAKIDQWRMWILCDREPVAVWGSGRATLLGDAAHPMLQYLAQGACMAIEDGWVLAESVSTRGANSVALREYEKQRYLRTGRCQIMARVYGDVYHAEGVARELRNKLLTQRTSEQAIAGFEWLYRGI
jgi:2-polyprenyl-6-methoxyphenol hydroxylase-like FAD-dependent oxidoreductase